MSTKTATIAGATGLIGNLLLNDLLEDNYFDQVRILVRSPVAISHPKLEIKLVDFNDSDSLLVALSGTDTLFCAIGTTNKKVKGDHEAYRRIDHDIPATLARLCKIAGCEKFIVVSAIGANPSSKNFYLRLKGEMEDSVKEAGLKSVHIMQPSQLLGNRKERRPREKIVQAIMKFISFLLPAKYKAVNASDVAKSMNMIVQKNKAGFYIYTYKEIKASIK